MLRLKVDQRAGQFSLPHLGITKTEKTELKHKNDEQRSPVNSLQPWDQSDMHEQKYFSQKCPFISVAHSIKQEQMTNYNH